MPERKQSQLELLTGKKTKKKRKIKKPPPVIVPKFRVQDEGRRLILLLEGYKLPSRANIQEHWTAKAKRTKEQRQGIKTILNTAEFSPKLPIIVTLCRIAPRQLDSDDNITMAFKAIRDGITDYLGLTNDDDIRLHWKYDQQSAAPRYYAIRVTLDCPPIE